MANRLKNTAYAIFLSGLVSLGSSFGAKAQSDSIQSQIESVVRTTENLLTSRNIDSLSSGDGFIFKRNISNKNSNQSHYEFIYESEDEKFIFRDYGSKSRGLGSSSKSLQDTLIHFQNEGPFLTSRDEIVLDGSEDYRDLYRSVWNDAINLTVNYLLPNYIEPQK